MIEVCPIWFDLDMDSAIAQLRNDCAIRGRDRRARQLLRWSSICSKYLA
ncbi:MAG: hypothetical protein ABI867_04240 [Kofleriaceae bacterium]